MIRIYRTYRTYAPASVDERKRSLLEVKATFKLRNLMGIYGYILVILLVSVLRYKILFIRCSTHEYSRFVLLR